MTHEMASTLLADAPGDGPAGQVIGGRYRLLEKLGEGGMGSVYLAEHLSLRKQVALKTIHATFDGHAEIAARFAREAMASARIEHPHVVSALDYGTLEGGGAYLVMQLARGDGLRSRLEQRGALPWRTACEVAEQIADAVAAAHAAGIVHRDLKPENVVLEGSESERIHVKVLDFGIAHLRSNATASPAQSSGAPLTQLGVVMGTPGYMAPEQAVGQPVDERADIYALGVMLWELIAGRRPFEGDTLTEIMTKQFAALPPPLPADAQPVPLALAKLVERMLAPRAEQRPQSAIAVRDELRALRATALPLALGRAKLSQWARDAASSRLTRLASDAASRLRQRVRNAPTMHKLALLAGAVVLALLLWRGLAAEGTADASPVSPAGQVSAKTRTRAAAPRANRAAEPASESEDGEDNEADTAPTRRESRVGAVRDRLRRIFR